MEYSFPTKSRPSTINVYVVSKKPQKICVVAYDKNKKNMQFVNHCGMVDTKSSYGYYRRRFEIMMPQSPEKLTVAVYGQAFGNKKGDKSFKVEKFGVTKLKTWEIWTSQHTKDFVAFAQRFSENADLLKTWEDAGKTQGAGVYTSDDGKFKIRYFDIIRNSEGKALTTPARISNRDGAIEVSKYYFKKYSVAMRMMILLHEYSHFWLNKNMANEIQADLNGLYVYLGLGYSPIEAHRAFLYVFDNADTEGNRVRYEMIKKYIYQFMTGGVAQPANHNQTALRKAA